MPVAQALVQVGRDVERLAGLAPEALWARPDGVASVGFRLKHVAGVLDRLSTYARGEALGELQTKALRAEAEPGEPPADAGPSCRRPVPPPSTRCGTRARAHDRLARRRVPAPLDAQRRSARKNVSSPRLHHERDDLSPAARPSEGDDQPTRVVAGGDRLAVDAHAIHVRAVEVESDRDGSPKAAGT
jgi:hypothetical protein